jgi:hypothetical protein
MDIVEADFKPARVKFMPCAYINGNTGHKNNIIPQSLSSARKKIRK